MNNIAIIGTGNLGSSIAKLLIKNGFKNNLILSDKNQHLKIMNDDIKTASNQESIDNSDTIFLAIKPNMINAVIDDINRSNDKKTIVSCAAAISINNIQDKLSNNDHSIIRIMPNIPVSLGHGTITYYAEDNVNTTDITKLENMLAGPYLLRVKDEKLIDVSTIFTASMPAFASVIAEEYIDFGIKHGFTTDEAIKLYISTITGTYEMLKHVAPEDIISMVATPNGVTSIGLKYMESYDLRATLRNSMDTSYRHLKSMKKILD